MITSNQIEEVKQRLVKLYNPLEIYIFGSYAWGHPDEESDLDVLIVVDECSPEKKIRAIVEGHRALIDLPLGKELMLLSKNEFDSKIKDKSTFIYKIKKQGRQIYAKA